MKAKILANFQICISAPLMFISSEATKSPVSVSLSSLKYYPKSSNTFISLHHSSELASNDFLINS